MSYESIRRKLEQPTTDNSQTTQSGFSASENRAEIKSRVQGYLTARKTQVAQNLFDPDAVERGRTKYETDKANAFAPQNEESTWEKIGRWLSGGTADTSLPMGGTAQVLQSKIAMPEKALEIGRLSDTARDEFYAQYDVDPAAAKAWAEDQIEVSKQQEAADLRDWAKEHPMWGNIVSLLPLQASGADYLNAVTDVWAGTNYYDPKDVSNPTAFMNTARAGAKEGSWLGTNPVGQFIDDVVYSSLQSLWSNVVSGGQIGAGPFSSLPLAFYSASSTINELMNEGYDPAQAGIVATTHGIVAFATEAIGSDTIIARALKNTKMGQSTKVFLKQLGKEIFRSMLAEGTEEVAEGVADQIIDSIVDLFFEKDTNEISRKKAEYLAENKSEEKASRMAVMSFAADLVKDFVAGGLSGGLMAGTTTAVGQGIETGTQTWNAYQYGKTGDKAELVENIKTIADTHGGTYGEGLEATGKKGFKGLWENLKIGMAMSEANRDIETDAIANRLIELGENEDTARAQAAVIYRMSREATVSNADERLVDTDIAKQVAREYSGSLETPRAAQHWVRDAWATQKAVSSTEPSPVSETTREAVRESIAAEKEAKKKAVTDEIATKFRKEQLIPYADKYGLNIEDILAQHTDITTGAYQRAIQDSFNLASAGYSLEQVKSTIKLPMEGVLLQSYNNGLNAYAKSKGAAPTQRVNIRANAKIELASESDVARNAPNAPYKAIDLNELKTKKPKVYAGMLFLSKFVAPRIKRKIVFFDGGSNTGGWRTADSIGINIGGSFELYRKTGNVVGLFMHEFGHDLRADSQELYDELRQIVINDIYKGDAAAFDAEVQAEMSSRAMVKSQYGEGANVDYINAEEEVIGNALAKVAESPESLERVFANNQGKQSIQRLFDMLKKLIGDIKEFFASFGHANSITDIIDENALAKIEDVLSRYVEQIDNTPIGKIAESMPSDTTGVTDVSEATKYSIVSFAEACGFRVDPETRTWQLTPPATKVTENDIRNSPIGALISYSLEMKDIGKAEADEQIAMFTRIANMCIGTNDFSMAMQFVGSSIFTGLKSNADKQYGTTYDFPSICTKTQAVIDAMSREMIRKKAGLTKDEIAIIYDKVWYDGNPVPCPECYVFSRWVGIGGLLDNIWHFQEMYSKMNPEQVRAEYKKYDAIFDEQFAELEAKRKEGEKKVTKGQLKNKAKSQLEKEYSALIEKQQKAQDGGAAFTEADAARLKEITPIYDTIRSMTYIQKVYFADDEMTTVNKNFVVPAEILFDLNRGEDFAKKYPAAWGYRTTQGAGYGKAITPYAEAVIGEGIIGTVSMAKQTKAKAAHAMTASDNVTDRKSNPFIESRGALNASARRTLESARRKQLNQAYIGGQRFQSTSDARFENFLDYLIAALEVQAMGGMVQMYTKVSGAVEATNAWGFSNNQSLMPKGGGIKNGVIQDTAHGGMVPSVAFENRQKYKYAGTITIGVNDEHIRAMFADVNRDFIIPYHASGGDRLLIATFRSILDSDEEAVQSTDYTRVQGEKILADDLLENVEDVHKFREQRLAILTRKGKLDMDYINAPGNELLRRVYDSVNSGRYAGAKLTKGVCEGQIFPNEYWDTSLSYEESGKIVEDYLEYCRRLGFLHKFSGLIQTYDQETRSHALVSLSGRDSSGNEVPLTDLAYKNGNPEDGVEPYYWKVLVDRRMYDNEGRYLPQQTIRLTSDTDRYATTFARNNKGSAREYSTETSAKTMEWIDEGGVRDTVMSLKDRGIELKSFSLKKADLERLFEPKTEAQLQTKWSTRKYFSDPKVQKLAAENPLIKAIFDTIQSSNGNKATLEFFDAVYREHPELNFTARIQENPNGEATERFRSLINSIDNAELVEDIRWFVPEFHHTWYDDNGKFMGTNYSYARKHMKAIKLIRQICDERIENLDNADGTGLGIKTGDTFEVGDIRNLFKSWNTHAELDDLADKVFDIAEKLNIAVVAVNDKDAARGYTDWGYWHGNLSRYGTGKTGLVAYQLPVFNSQSITDDYKAQTLLHEMIHACTSNIIHAVESLSLTAEQEDAIHPYVRLIEQEMSYLRRHYKWTASSEDMYGMTNVHEFLAEMSNPAFRKALASVNDEDLKRLLVHEHTLRSWLNTENLETYSVSVLEKLLSDFSMEVYTRFSSLRKYRETSNLPKYSVRREAPPQKTKKAYKLMRYVDGKFYPLFIGNTEEVKPGVWYNADSPNLSQLKSLAPGTHLLNIETGDSITWDQYAKRNQLKRKNPNAADIKWASENGYRFMYIEDKAGTASEGIMTHQYGDTRAYYNWGINGSSKTKTGEGSAQIYALRPGWHFGELPSMQQIGYGTNDDKFRLDNQVWVEVEMAADVDYSKEAASNYSGDIPDHIPHNGYYTFATNPVSKKTKAGNSEADRTKADWYVAGAFKIVRALSDSEADAIVNKYNAEHGTNIPVDYRRQNGKVFNADTMSLEDASKFSERRVTGFYSQMGRVIEQAKANSFDARSLINMLLGKGVKAEEIKWSGLTTFLDGKKSVSKSDLLEFIQDSMIEITEEERSGRSARFGLYTVEGDFSNNYREYLFKWSDLGYSNDMMDIHWGEPNVLAHARVDDTTDSQGNDVLFIEEIQSDWHNAAASAKGYMSADDFQKKQKISQPIAYFEDWVGEAYDAYGSKTENPGPRMDEFNVKMKDLGAPWRIMFDHGRYNVREGNKTLLAGGTWGEFLDELVDLDFTDYEEVGDQLYGTMPPEAPFKNNKYTDFVMKNMLRKAAAEGYEKIAWTTAKTQAERWSDDYSKAYEIEYDQDIPKFLEKFGKQWGAKPSLEKLDNGVVAWTFPITEAMRESVVYEGQSLYSMRRIEDHTTIKSGSLFSGAGLLEQGLMYQLLIHDFGVEYNNSIAATWQENNGDGHIYAGETEGNVFNFDGKKYKGKMFHIHASPVCHNLSPAKHGYGEQPSDIASARKTLQIFLDAEAPVYTVENAKLYAKTESARIIKEGLENAGYIVDIGVYNSADYGSAQSRERTIIRAVRGDLVMPDRPRKLPRTRTWDQVTRSLWDELKPITVNDIADSYLRAVKNTGIDITNVKVPTLLLQTTSGGTVTFAREGTQCPTLTTKCDEAVLCLPGGVILKPSTAFLGRLMGLPDDFKYPHYKNNPERIKTSVAATIIGNGIPVELTKAVVGGVIESAYQQIEGHALYSMRRVNNDLSPREYLTQATIETIKSPKERAEFERLATEYRTLDDKSLLLQSQIADLDFRIEQTRWEIKALDDALLKTDAQNSEKVTNLIKRYGSASEAMKELKAQLSQAQADLRALRKEEAEVEDRMSDILTVPLVERILDKQRKLTLEYERLLESTKAADQQKLANLRITMGEKVQEEIDRRIEMRKNLTAKFREREGVSYYLPRLQSALKDLATNVTKAPEPFRGPVYKILSLFDLKTRDKNGNLKKGQANIDRQEAQDRLKTLLGTGSGSIQEWFAKYNIEISDDVRSWIEDTRSYLEWIILNQEELRVRSASAKEIQSAYHFVRMLNTQLKTFTKAYTKTSLDMSRLGKMAADYADSLGTRKSSEVGGIAKLMRYEHAQPITVLDRLGDAGREVFKLLAAGEGKRARNEQEIADFISTWNQADVKRWINPKETVDVKFQVLDEEGEPVIDEDGNEVFTTVKMTPAQMMTIYCTARDAAGLRHLLIGGFKLADVVQTRKGRKYHINDTVRKMTGTDLSNLIASMNAYDEKLIPFANSLQNFIDTVGSMWGNQVSIRRFGYEQFDVENYFPIITTLRNRTSDISKKAKLGELTSQIFALINRSFTKDRLANASNPLIIQNVFDVFFEHMEDMAIYNAYALPVLDTMRFLQYTQYDEKGKEVWNLDEKLNNAYGNGVMQNYIMRLLVSINGERPMTNAENLALTALRLRNRVAVAANIRVVAQQPLSIARALEVIPAKYIRPFGDFKATYHEMIEHSDIALKKSQGYFGADVKRSLMEKVLGSGSEWYNKYYDAINKATELGMKPAELGDALTWTILWNACRNWVQDTNPELSEDEFLKAVDERFTDIVYRTQVVDSVLQKSEFMRHKDFWHRSTSSFKGEPTTSYNTLLRLYDRVIEARQRGENLAQVWSSVKKPMLKAFVSYALNTLLIALATAVADAFRDDDDYETWWEKFQDALYGRRQGFIKSNLFESLNPFDLPVFSEAFALLQGYKADRVDLMFIQETIDIANAINNFTEKANWKDGMKLLGGVSMLSGLPLQNVAREVIATWNFIVNFINPELKIETSPAPKNLGYEQFYNALTSENYVRATELIDEIMSNAKDEKEAYQGITSQIHDAFKNGKLTEDEAFDYLNICESYVPGIDRTDKQQRQRIEDWKEAMTEKGLKWKE